MEENIPCQESHRNICFFGKGKNDKKWIKLNDHIEEPNKDSIVVDFDPVSFQKHLKSYFRHLDQSRNLADNQINSCFQIGYKEALDAARQQDVLSFLGSSADSASLKSNYVKQHSASIQDSFANWDSLLDYLEKINLTHFVYSGIDICEDRGGFV